MLATLERRVANDLIPQLARAVERDFKRRVKSTKTAPDGKRWAKRKRPAAWPLMYKSHDLHSSIQITDMGRQGLSVGSDLDYAKFQHGGTSRGLAARPIFGVGEKLDRELKERVDRWVGRRWAS